MGNRCAVQVAEGNVAMWLWMLQWQVRNTAVKKKSANQNERGILLWR